MLERLTALAQAAVTQARLEARALKHNYTGTEHLLLALTRERDCGAARALSSVGVTTEDALDQVRRLVPPPAEAAGSEVPLTPRLNRVLELALEEARSGGHDLVRTEHLLLGLLRGGRGVALAVLAELGADAEAIRATVAESAADRADEASFPTEALERFTRRARQAVVLAREEAILLKHDYIGTEHILLGLLREEEGLAARALGALGLTTVEPVRAQVARIVGQGKAVAPKTPATPRVRKVIELAGREAWSLGHDLVGTEHLLLGLVRENEGAAARILLELDVDSGEIQNEVLALLSGPGSRRRAAVCKRVLASKRSIRGVGRSELLLDGAGSVLRTLGRELEERAQRPLDAGDLAVLLASVPDGLAARALAGLGADAPKLAAAAEEARREQVSAAFLPDAVASDDELQLEVLNGVLARIALE